MTERREGQRTRVPGLVRFLRTAPNERLDFERVEEDQVYVLIEKYRLGENNRETLTDITFAWSERMHSSLEWMSKLSDPETIGISYEEANKLGKQLIELDNLLRHGKAKPNFYI